MRVLEQIPAYLDWSVKKETLNEVRELWPRYEPSGCIRTDSR